MKRIDQLSMLPQVGGALEGWAMPLQLYIITQTVTNGFVRDVPHLLHVRGVWQPLKAEEIELKPEQQRSWEWVDLHIIGGDTVFSTNDRVQYSGIIYKVMAVKDYRLNGYTEYHLVKDYQ